MSAAVTTTAGSIPWISDLARALRAGGMPLCSVDTSYLTPFEHEQLVIEAGTAAEREEFCQGRGWPLNTLKASEP